MKATWDSSPITVRHVQEAIRPKRKLAYTTVMTIMDRLDYKGCLNRTLHLSNASITNLQLTNYCPRLSVADPIKELLGSRERLLGFPVR